MAWDIPDIPGAGTIATVAGWATKLISCLRYLKGLDSQVPTIQSGLIIDNTDGDEYLKLPLLTTAQAGTVLVTEGKVAFDSQTHTPKYYNGTAVKDIGDHGSLGGLTDDDHTIYIKHSLADAANDFLVASEADAFVKKTLAETKTILAIASPTSGTYTGDASTDRAIAHGLGVAPKIVFTFNSTDVNFLFIITGLAKITRLIGGTIAFSSNTVTAPNATNFYVGDASDDYGNVLNKVYYWVAIG